MYFLGLKIIPDPDKDFDPENPYDTILTSKSEKFCPIEKVESDFFSGFLCKDRNGDMFLLGYFTYHLLAENLVVYFENLPEFSFEKKQ